MDQIQKLNELRDGIFQVAMLLYTEYAKYMGEGDARTCVFNDLVEKARKFTDQDISGSSPNTIAVDIIKAKKNALLDSYKNAKTADEKYRLTEQIEKLDDVIKILK